MKDGNFIIKFRWLIIIGFLGISLFFGLQIRNAEIDTDLTNMMPSNMPSRINTDSIEQMFGGLDLAMIIFECDDVINKSTLQRVKDISVKINRLKGVDQVISLFDLKNIKGEYGAMIVDPAVKKIPQENTEIEILRKEIVENELVYGIVISEDFQYTAIIASILDEVDDDFIVTALYDIVESTPGDETIIYGGMPFTRIEIDKSTKKDLFYLLPIGLLIMIVFLFFSFKQWRGVILPFSVVIMSIMVGMGCIPLFGWEMNMTTILLPVMLIAIANDYGIHLIARFQEDNREGNTHTPARLAKMMFLALGRPVVLTGLTTMAGMLCLLGHAMIPAKQLGILSSIGIIYALAASLLFIPAVTSLLKKPAPVIFLDEQKSSWLEIMLGKTARLISLMPGRLILFGIMFIVLSGSGILLLNIDANPENYFNSKHPVKISANVMNEEFGGSQNISMVIEGDIKAPDVMNRIDSYDKKIKEINGVGNTTSIAAVVRKMSKAINDPGEDFYDSIPDSRNAIAQYFMLYNMNGDPEDFERLVDFDYQNTQVICRINNSNTSVVNKVINEMNIITEGDNSIILKGGYASIFSDFARLVVNGQFFSLFLSIAVVSIMLMILFRSIIAGLISAIPISISMLVLFGSMGYFGINLNVATAMLSSIMIGVGIDYTIHYLWRFRSEIKKGKNEIDAISISLKTTGRGITINAFSVIVGFSILMVSGFKPVQFYGFLVVVTILSCLIGAIVLIPAICMMLKPKFLGYK